MMLIKMEFPDVFDACPLEPETYNIFEDCDGCPDTVDAIDSILHF